MGKARERKRRRFLHEQDQRCRRCGIVTELPETLAARFGGAHCIPPLLRLSMATLEHPKSRWHPQGRSWLGATTLFCWKCNAASNHAEILRQPLAARQRGPPRERAGRDPP